jgi:ribosomal protein S18 acetylase RimI-like enzyme
VKDILLNPVYNALLTGDKHLSFGTAEVKYFDEQVSPFAGFREDYANGFSDLHEMLPGGRRILYAIPRYIAAPKGWQVLHEVRGLQFIYEGNHTPATDFSRVKPLTEEHVEEMITLTQLTRPGPFGSKTIRFGHYFGIFENGKLAAMTGQRLHVENYTEVSAVCTHPDFLGKGYATILLQHQLQLILQQDRHPILHVRDDNERAISVYERSGFRVSSSMNFYFMKRE